MPILSFYQVDAFSDLPLKGNPAAVMLLDEWLDDETLLAIAAENNLSETAFAVRADGTEADYQLRWFTPTVEVDMCGHATLATGHILIEGDRVNFSTRAGILTVIRRDGLLELHLPAYSVASGEVPGLAEALGANGKCFIGQGPEPAVIVLLPDEDAVRSVAPDFGKLANLHYLVIVTAPGETHSVVSRVFCPFIGINEDPVTGAAHAALTPFWAERLGRNRFTAYQASRRGGQVHCRQEGDRAVLGGRCVTVIAGQFHL